MKVSLLNKPTLKYTDVAIGECYNKGPYCDTDKMIKRIDKVALQNKHSSVLEFTNFVFEITASTKVLLEMTRHRMASYACKSSRYTLNKGEIVFELTGNSTVDTYLAELKGVIQALSNRGISNDIVSLMLPQAYQYVWVVQFNARSLQNFLDLRRDKAAHFHIREVADEMYKQIPDDMKFIFEKGKQ
jgi:thymidylate synthase (FAD)